MSVLSTKPAPRRQASWLAAAALALAATLATVFPAHAGVGLSSIAATEQDGPITVFYPSTDPDQTTTRGPFTLQAVREGAPAKGNGRLVVISHGSGASPWVYSDLARALVQAGFVVALPEHRGDNYKDTSQIGPPTWKQRPAEVSRAIDAVGRDARFAPLLDLQKVGVYGMSAGGHTVLSLAGGTWSPGNFKRHCEAHIQEDFYSCVGLTTRQTGGVLDGVKIRIALALIRSKLDDDTPETYQDPRVAALVASVPFAADFDMASLTAPRVPLALVTAGQDRWLTPKFHSDRVLAACKTCVHLAHLPTAGHGALLSPLPPGFTGLAAELMNDPPGFDRAQLPAVDAKIAAFFVQYLAPTK
ncbi:MAG: alpha/beta hydrolase family protein [Burkholderiaceae bacterium]